MNLKDQILDEELEDLADLDNIPPTEAQSKFAEGLKELLQSLIQWDDLTD